MNKYFSLKKTWKEVVDAGSGTETKSFRQKTNRAIIWHKSQYKTSVLTRQYKVTDRDPGRGKKKKWQEIFKPQVGAKRWQGNKKESKSRIKRKSTEIVERQNTEFHDRMEQHHQAKMTRMDRFLDLYEKGVNSKTNYNLMTAFSLLGICLVQYCSKFWHKLSLWILHF